MTNRIGNKDEAHQRSKEEKARIKASNVAQEAVKKVTAAEKYHNEVKGQPRAATPLDAAKSDEKKKIAPPAKAKSVKLAKPATKTAAAKTVKAKSVKAASDESSKDNKSHDKAGLDKGAGGGKKQERQH